MIIAVDFDGTIVEHDFPEIGRLREGAVEVLQKLASEGHRTIIWTCREGGYEIEAREFLRNNAIPFVAINENDPELNFPTSRKIFYDVLIDDRNIGGLPSWNEIYEMIQKLSRRF